MLTTAKIVFIFISQTAGHTYDFHIFIVIHYNSVAQALCIYDWKQNIRMFFNRITGEGDVKNDTPHLNVFWTCCFDHWMKDIPFFSRNLGFWQLSPSWRPVYLQIKSSSDEGEDSTSMTGQIFMKYSTSQLRCFYIQDLQVGRILFINPFAPSLTSRGQIKPYPCIDVSFSSHYLSTWSCSDTVLRNLFLVSQESERVNCFVIFHISLLCWM